MEKEIIIDFYLPDFQQGEPIHADNTWVMIRASEAYALIQAAEKKENVES